MCQKQEEADHIVSYAAAILDLDLYADDDDGQPRDTA